MKKLIKKLIKYLAKKHWLIVDTELTILKDSILIIIKDWEITRFDIEGDVERLGVWNRELEKGEFKQIQANPLKCKCNPIEYYNLDK